MAFLLEAGHIHVAEVMVYTRAFDDAIDAVLMRSKAEAELERLKSDAARLAALHAALTASSARPAGSVALKVLVADSVQSIRPSSAMIAGSDAATPISTGGHGRAPRLLPGPRADVGGQRSVGPADRHVAADHRVPGALDPPQPPPDRFQAVQRTNC